MPLLSAAGIDWKAAVHACRAGEHYAACLKVLLANNNSIGGVFTVEDIAALCVDRSDKTACYLDLQKTGVDFGSMEISPETISPVALNRAIAAERKE